jgi:hypothetical protein
MNLSMRNGPRNILLSSVALGAALLTAGCSGGGDTSTSTLTVTAVNLVEGSVWRINRPIKISFNQPIDFASVTLNSFNIRRPNGAPAAGEFYTEDGGKTVVFQPLCPTRDDLSDAGLRAGTDPLNNDAPYSYELNLIGVDKSSTLPIRARNGVALALSQTRRFTTPVSTNPLNLYLDTKVGPPVANVERTDLPSDNELNVLAAFNPTYVEVGGPGGSKHFFKSNGVTLTIDPPLPTNLPLNPLSNPAEQVALIVGINQAVDPSSLNINSSRLRWEFTDDGSLSSAVWTPLTTTVTLESNCSIVGTNGAGDTVAVPGARLRVTPTGVLPPSADLRAVLAAEFSDIVGETNPVQQAGFAEAPTQAFPTNPPTLADHFLEDFDTAANNDATASFAEPRADWGNGELAAKFSFTGTGGPGGNFDWYIDNGEIVIFNTANGTINGFQITFAPNSDNITQVIPTGQQTIVGGVVDVNDFYIEAGGTLKVEGPNPFTLMASGRVVIRGKVDCGGSSNQGVNTLNVTNIPEPGAPGQCGGGKGGTGSPLTTASSPRGGTGFGAFNVPDLGGQGGETGWSNAAGENTRRGGGGGGGTLGKNEFANFAATGTLFDQRRIGYDAEPGFNNALATNSAINGAGPARGGAVSPSVFGDPNPNNNFFGSQFNLQTSVVTVGELVKPWAGAGGGAGGDASRVVSGTFPGPWNPAGDEKGSGGAGGGGSVQIMALGPIVFGVSGQLLARGGVGGGGENTIFLNRVGGGGGGGSGGHVVLQSSQKIDFSAKVGVNFANISDVSFAIDCRGGQGGAGDGDLGGGIQSTTGQRETLPLQDACPTGYPTTGTNACRGLVNGAGGDGGPGIIQLHTSTGIVGPSTTPQADIVLPTTAGITLAEICAPPPLSRDNTVTTPTTKMIPTFGKISRARSNWIALGQGGFNGVGAQYKNIVFDFEGLNSATGIVQRDPVTGIIPLASSILGPATIDSTAVNLPFVVLTGPNAGYQLVMDATSLVGSSNQPLLDNTALLEHTILNFATPAVGSPTAQQRYEVVSASFDPATNRLTLNTDRDGASMIGFNLTNASVTLHRAYFRVISSGAQDFMPLDGIRLTFEAAQADPATGLPNTATIVGPTSDMSVFNNAATNRNLRFVRFNVTFDIAAGNQPLTATNPIPALEFLRLPFKYQ